MYVKKKHGHTSTNPGKERERRGEVHALGWTNPEYRIVTRVQGLSWVDRPGMAHRFSYNGLRPGPAYQTFIWWAASWPGVPVFHITIRGPARPGPPFFSISRPSPARPPYFPMSRPGPAHDIRSEVHETRTLYGPSRRRCGPACGIDGPVHVLSRTNGCVLKCNI